MTTRSRGLVPAITALVALCACGSSPAPQDEVHGTARSHLLTLAQLGDPGFTVLTGPADLDAAALAADVGAGPKTGPTSAADVRYFRDAGSFAESNGPIDVLPTVALFADADAAHAWFDGVSSHLKGPHDATQFSTGPLGDEAVAVAVTRSTPDGVNAVQFTVAWRVGNAVDVLVVRGRDGGTRLDDALYLARQQTLDER